MLLAVSILACAVGFGLLVYRYDMYEREPWYMLVLAVALGGAAFWFLGHAEDFVVLRLTGGTPTAWALAAVAGVMEELLKLLIVITIWVALPRQFNDPFDGLIYGATVGIGFALAESVFYVGLVGHRLTWGEAIGQEVTRLMLHLLMGAISCFGLGLARFRIRGWPFFLVGGLTTSMLLHFAWDYCCGLPALQEVDFPLQRVIAVILMLSLIGLFGLSVMLTVKHSRDQHGVNELRGLWGWPFTALGRHRKE